MFKKEYFFIFVIIGLSIVYVLLSLLSFLTRGKWLKITSKKLAVGAMIVAFTALLNFGSIAFSQQTTPDPTISPTPVYGTMTPTPDPGTDYSTPTETPAPAPEYGVPVAGDVNQDLSIDIVDALLIAQQYVGLEPPNFDRSLADVDCSDKIDIVDALLVAQMYVGLIDEFPCSDTP
jgi:hypothetical protein